MTSARPGVTAPGAAEAEARCNVVDFSPPRRAGLKACTTSICNALREESGRKGSEMSREDSVSRTRRPRLGGGNCCQLTYSTRPFRYLFWLLCFGIVNVGSLLLRAQRVRAPQSAYGRRAPPPPGPRFRGRGLSRWPGVASGFWSLGAGAGSSRTRANCTRAAQSHSQGCTCRLIARSRWLALLSIDRRPHLHRPALFVRIPRILRRGGLCVLATVRPRCSCQSFTVACSYRGSFVEACSAWPCRPLFYDCASGSPPHARDPSPEGSL